MTATNFRDLLAGWQHPSPPGPRLVDYADADEMLAMPAIDCPTCDAKGRVVAFGEEYTGEVVACGTTPCPACTGTGKATVAQLLAWGSAVAQTDPEDWIEFGDQRSAIVGYRNQILDTKP